MWNPSGTDLSHTFISLQNFCNAVCKFARPSRHFSLMETCTKRSCALLLSKVILEIIKNHLMQISKLVSFKHSLSTTYWANFKVALYWSHLPKKTRKWYFGFYDSWIWKENLTSLAQKEAHLWSNLFSRKFNEWNLIKEHDRLRRDYYTSAQRTAKNVKTKSGVVDKFIHYFVLKTWQLNWNT